MGKGLRTTNRSATFEKMSVIFFLPEGRKEGRGGRRDETNQEFEML